MEHLYFLTCSSTVGQVPLQRPRLRPRPPERGARKTAPRHTLKREYADELHTTTGTQRGVYSPLCSRSLQTDCKHKHHPLTNGCLCVGLCLFAVSNTVIYDTYWTTCIWLRGQPVGSGASKGKLHASSLLCKQKPGESPDTPDDSRDELRTESTRVAKNWRSIYFMCVCACVPFHLRQYRGATRKPNWLVDLHSAGFR